MEENGCESNTEATKLQLLGRRNDLESYFPGRGLAMLELTEKAFSMDVSEHFKMAAGEPPFGLGLVPLQERRREDLSTSKSIQQGRAHLGA